jgi:5,5'-dehydrodivanillate O-demethylase oxygenase subunit
LEEEIMLSKEENELLTRVGPRTPAGEMLRRYWWPVAFSDDVKSKGAPVKIKFLTEEFALFRDGAGELGLVALHCSHRGTSLEFGRVEEKGIRCCYHGWLYDVRGNCLEQPAEPGDSTFKERIKHPAFYAQDAAGLIFAYIGPEPAPLLPSYDLLVREDGCRVVGGDEENCNWLQRAENSADGAHSIALHAAGYPNMALKRPTIKWEPTPFGIKETTWVEDVAKPRISHYVFPSHVRHSAARVGERPRQVIRFRVPTDDFTTTTYWIDFHPHRDGKPTLAAPLTVTGFRKNQPGVYERVTDGWWNLPNREQDRVAQETQGLIADRTKEHLATSDQGILMLRKMIRQSIDAVQQGKDPIGVIRDATRNGPITFDSSRDAVEALV